MDGRGREGDYKPEWGLLVSLVLLVLVIFVIFVLLVLVLVVHVTVTVIVCGGGGGGVGASTPWSQPAALFSVRLAAPPSLLPFVCIVDKQSFLHKSRHNHAMRRVRGPGGRFLTKAELNQYRKQLEEQDPEGATAPAEAPANGKKPVGGGWGEGEWVVGLLCGVFFLENTTAKHQECTVRVGPVLSPSPRQAPRCVLTISRKNGTVH